MEQVNDSIQLWTKLQYIGVPVIGAIFGGIFYLISQSQIDKYQKIKNDIEESKNPPILGIDGTEFAFINLRGGIITIHYEIFCYSDHLILLENTTMSLLNSPRTYTEDFTKQIDILINHQQGVSPSNVNARVTKGLSFRATFASRDILSPNIITALESKKSDLYWLGVCNYTTTSNGKKWRYVFVIAGVHQTS